MHSGIRHHGPWVWIQQQELEELDQYDTEPLFSARTPYHEHPQQRTQVTPPNKMQHLVFGKRHQVKYHFLVLDCFLKNNSGCQLKSKTFFVSRLVHLRSHIALAIPVNKNIFHLWPPPTIPPHDAANRKPRTFAAYSVSSCDKIRSRAVSRCLFPQDSAFTAKATCKPNGYGHPGSSQILVDHPRNFERLRQRRVVGNHSSATDQANALPVVRHFYSPCRTHR